MRFNRAAALVAGASLVQAQEYCSDRSTIVVTEYVTLPGPVNSTPAASVPVSSSVEGLVSSAEETTQVQVVTIKPVPATSTPVPVTSTPPVATPSPPMTTSTVYSSSSSVNAEGEVVWQTISQYTTVCPVTQSEATATPVTTPTPEPTQWTTSTIYTTSASVDATGGTVYITVPHTTTVCPVTATEAALSTISSTSKCKTTRTVTVNPEPVTVTVTPSAAAAVDGAVGAAAAEPSSWTSATVVPVETVVYTETPAAASSSAAADGVVAAAAVEPSSSSSASIAVDTPVYTPAPVESSASVAPVETVVYTETPAASATPAADAGVDGLTGFPSSGSVAVDTPVYTPAPAMSTPVVVGTPVYTPSVAVDTPVYTPVYTPSVAVDTPVYTPSVAVDTPVYTPSVAVDTPVYTPAPASSTPVVSVEQVASSSSVAQSTFVTSSAPAASSSSAGLVSSVGSTVNGLTAAVTGEATFYSGNVAGGTCSFTSYSLPASLFGTALSGSNWDTASNCGACVNVQGPSGNTITAMIVDQCPECGDNQLDLFEGAFTELASASTGTIDISWEIVECGITTPLQLANKEGTSEYWFSMQVSNSNVPVKSLHVSTDNGSTWTETTRSEYNFFEYESGFGTSTVDIKVTSSTGKEVITKNVTVGSGTTHECDSNF